MSLFKCSNPDCQAIENTALSNFWNWLIEYYDSVDLPGELPGPFCSACDPKIGKWHGCFPKEKFNPKYYEFEEPGSPKQFVRRKQLISNNKNYGKKRSPQASRTQPKRPGSFKASPKDSTPVQ